MTNTTTPRKQLTNRFKKVQKIFVRFNWQVDIYEHLERDFNLLYKYKDEHIWLENSWDRPLLLLLNWVDGVIYVYYQSISLEVHDIIKVKTIIEECGDLSFIAEIKKGLKELKFQNLTNKEKRCDQYDIWIPGNYPYKVLFWFKWLNQTYTYYILLHITDMKGYFTSFNPLKEFKDNLILGNYKLDKYIDDSRQR